MRVIAIHAAATHSVDLVLDDVPRIGDHLELEGQQMVVRSVIVAAPDTDVTAFVYLLPFDHR